MQANIIEPARDMDLRLRTINSIHNRIPIRRFTPSWGPALSNEYTEPLSGLALLPIQQKRSFYHLKDLLLGVDFINHGTKALTLTPNTTDHNFISCFCFCHTIKITGIHTLTAVVAGIPIDLHDAILVQMGIFHGADLYDGALLAAIAVIGIIGRYPLAHNAEIIQTWLNTVVWAAADADFELVRQFDICPADVVFFVQLFGERLCIVVAVDARGTLTCGDGAYFSAGAAEVEATLGSVIAGGVNLLEGDADDLGGQAGGERHLAAAEFFGNLGDGAQVGGGEDRAGADETAGEALCTAIDEEAAALDGRDLFGF